MAMTSAEAMAIIKKQNAERDLKNAIVPIPKPTQQQGSPVNDLNGNAYVINNDGNGYATVGKWANGNYAISENQRYATQDEANRMVPSIAAAAKGQHLDSGLLNNPLAQQVGGAQSPTATDNSGMINNQYDSIATALKAAIAQQKNNKEQQISGLNAKYQPMKNTNEVNKNNNLRSVLEQNVNSGDRGGVGRQNALETQTAAQNVNNSIDLQKTQEETSIRNDIANLILEGDIQGAQNQAARLKDLIANNLTMDETNYNRSQDTLSNSIAQQTANNNQAITDANLKEKAAETTIRETETLIAANYNNISALRDQIQKANPNDPRLPQIQAAINQKVADQKATQAAAGTAAQKTAYDNAFEAWKQLGYATPQIAAILGVPSGSKTAAYNIDKMQVAISQQNANTSRESVGVSQQNANTNRDQLAWAKDPTNPDNIAKSPTYNYKTDTDWASDYDYAINNPTGAASTLKSNATALIKAYGVDGYNALLKATQGE